VHIDDKAGEYIAAKLVEMEIESLTFLLRSRAILCSFLMVFVRLPDDHKEAITIDNVFLSFDDFASHSQNYNGRISPEFPEDSYGMFYLKEITATELLSDSRIVNPYDLNRFSTKKSTDLKKLALYKLSLRLKDEYCVRPFFLPKHPNLKLVTC
jgi:hypothetical protein